MTVSWRLFDRPGAVAAPGAAARSGWGRAIEESLVLLVPGVTFVLLGIYLLSSHSHLGPSRWPIWELIEAMGAIALAGGIASVFAEGDDLPLDGVGGRPEPLVHRDGSVGPVVPEPATPGIPIPDRGRPLPRLEGPPSVLPAERVGRASWDEIERLFERAARAPPTAPSRPRFDSVEEALQELDSVEELLRASRDRTRRRPAPDAASWDGD